MCETLTQLKTSEFNQQILGLQVFTKNNFSNRNISIGLIFLDCVYKLFIHLSL